MSILKGCHLGGAILAGSAAFHFSKICSKIVPTSYPTFAANSAKAMLAKESFGLAKQAASSTFGGFIEIIFV
jgi:hypothetical protein